MRNWLLSIRGSHFSILGLLEVCLIFIKNTWTFCEQTVKILIRQYIAYCDVCVGAAFCQRPMKSTIDVHVKNIITLYLLFFRGGGLDSVVYYQQIALQLMRDFSFFKPYIKGNGNIESELKFTPILNHVICHKPDQNRIINKKVIAIQKSKFWLTLSQRRPPFWIFN